MQIAVAVIFIMPWRYNVHLIKTYKSMGILIYSATYVDVDVEYDK